MPSSCRNFRATDTFSSFWLRNVGRFVYLGIRFWDNTSINAISRRPSDRSVSRLFIDRSIVFRCSLAQRVNVFCWIFFHCASSARSRSASMSSSKFSSYCSDCCRILLEKSGLAIVHSSDLSNELGRMWMGMDTHE